MNFPPEIMKALKNMSRANVGLFQSQLVYHLQENGIDFDQFVKKFNRLKTNLERVDYVYEKMDLYNVFEGNFTADEKNDVKANALKERGNQVFAKGKYAKALRYYTKCISKAKSQEILALGYANRSAALFKSWIYIGNALG